MHNVGDEYPREGLQGAQTPDQAINSFFTNESSANRIMYGISEMLNKKWKCKTLKPIYTN
jgi:hypothetical protein